MMYCSVQQSINDSLNNCFQFHDPLSTPFLRIKSVERHAHTFKSPHHFQKKSLKKYTDQNRIKKQFKTEPPIKIPHKIIAQIIMNTKIQNAKSYQKEGKWEIKNSEKKIQIPHNNLKRQQNLAYNVQFAHKNNKFAQNTISNIQLTRQKVSCKTNLKSTFHTNSQSDFQKKNEQSFGIQSNFYSNNKQIKICPTAENNWTPFTLVKQIETPDAPAISVFNTLNPKLAVSQVGSEDQTGFEDQRSEVLQRYLSNQQFMQRAYF